MAEYWENYNPAEPAEAGNAIAIGNGDIMGYLPEYDESNNTFQFVTDPDEVNFTIKIINNLAVDQNGQTAMGTVTHVAREGFPGGGGLVKPK